MHLGSSAYTGFGQLMLTGATLLAAVSEFTGFSMPCISSVSVAQGMQTVLQYLGRLSTAMADRGAEQTQQHGDSVARRLLGMLRYKEHKLAGVAKQAWAGHEWVRAEQLIRSINESPEEILPSMLVTQDQQSHFVFFMEAGDDASSDPNDEGLGYRLWVRPLSKEDKLPAVFAGDGSLNSLCYKPQDLVEGSAIMSCFRDLHRRAHQRRAELGYTDLSCSVPEPMWRPQHQAESFVAASAPSPPTALGDGSASSAAAAAAAPATPTGMRSASAGDLLLTPGERGPHERHPYVHTRPGEPSPAGDPIEGTSPISPVATRPPKKKGKNKRGHRDDRRLAQADGGDEGLSGASAAAHTATAPPAPISSSPAATPPPQGKPDKVKKDKQAKNGKKREEGRQTSEAAAGQQRTGAQAASDFCGFGDGGGGQSSGGSTFRHATATGQGAQPSSIGSARLFYGVGSNGHRPLVCVGRSGGGVWGSGGTPRRAASATSFFFVGSGFAGTVQEEAALDPAEAIGGQRQPGQGFLVDDRFPRSSEGRLLQGLCLLRLQDPGPAARTGQDHVSAS
jgi:hypothetical protein